MANLTGDHLGVVKLVICYLNGTSDTSSCCGDHNQEMLDLGYRFASYQEKEELLLVMYSVYSMAYWVDFLSCNMWWLCQLQSMSKCYYHACKENVCIAVT